MSIIQVRGTSGAGKTTVVRKVMACMPQGCSRWSPVFIKGRKQPLYYERDGIVVLGQYEIATGGGDTIGSVPQIFKVVKELPWKTVRHVIVEGLLLSEDAKWVLNTKIPGQDYKILYLNVDGEECLRRVGLRQQAAGREPKDPERVRRKLLTRVGTIQRARVRLEAAGIYCRSASPNQAPGIILSWLRD